MPTLQALASKFTWYSHTEDAVDSINNDIFYSRDGGIQDISFEQCTQICLLIPNCKVVAYFQVWYGDPSASGWSLASCFAKDQSMVPKLRGSTSSTPLQHKSHRGWSYWGYKLV